ncbi:hypothetical protein [Desulfosporosinus sp. Sb-LF]|uniref:hypothetical protein n=1 Tax=Desulfosporosinus sp. Sb-LF TaxID=2560027 RepID=UPI00107F2DAF|nr:hypothetical protein [Desulfosporosinus sp. Sb-LF]TGE31209.1 hypothetical protein E4K68_18405 [Desulfosporosinus sp. Sb-LF]
MSCTWLGRDWEEVKIELERVGKPYAFQITRPHGKMDSWGSFRVVRVREFDDHVDVVLAHEKFSQIRH